MHIWNKTDKLKIQCTALQGSYVKFVLIQPSLLPTTASGPAGTQPATMRLAPTSRSQNDQPGLSRPSLTYDSRNCGETGRSWFPSWSSKRAGSQFLLDLSGADRQLTNYQSAKRGLASAPHYIQLHQERLFLLRCQTQWSSGWSISSWKRRFQRRLYKIAFSLLAEKFENILQNKQSWLVFYGTFSVFQHLTIPGPPKSRQSHVDPPEIIEVA